MKRSNAVTPGRYWWMPFAIVCLLSMSLVCPIDEANSAADDQEMAQGVETTSSVTGIPVDGSTAITYEDKFYDVAMSDKAHIWAVGYYGTIVHSSDGGRHWTRQDAGTQHALTGIYFINRQEGFIVGDQGTILHTIDGGRSWTAQASPVLDQKLLKVQFLDPKEGFAVGSFGTILHTGNGGESWEKLPFDEDITLNDLFFLTPLEGWIAGEFETILHTADGGKTFERQRGDELGQIFGITFKNDQRGIAVGTTGKILVTSNGGLKWEEKKKPSEDTLLKVQFFDSELFAIGLRGSMVVSMDDGENWSLKIIPGHYSWLSGIAFEDGVGVVVGNDGKILASGNYGNKWTRMGFYTSENVMAGAGKE